MSKILILKAIHNLILLWMPSLSVVKPMSKILILKAIHNLNLHKCFLGNRCEANVKDTDFESNSQLVEGEILEDRVVKPMSKILILKAIHNYTRFHIYSSLVVKPMSKILILKAIHNWGVFWWSLLGVVKPMSKILILKAIHNHSRHMTTHRGSCEANVKDTDFESNSQHIESFDNFHAFLNP